MPHPKGFKEIVIDSQRIPGLQVSLNWDCREGQDGEYDPYDPTDVPLLRFDILFKGEQVENGSYCTQLSAWEKRPTLRKAAEVILREAESTLNLLDSGELESVGFKRRMADTSWIRIENGILI